MNTPNITEIEQEIAKIADELDEALNAAAYMSYYMSAARDYKDKKTCEISGTFRDQDVIEADRLRAALGDLFNKYRSAGGNIKKFALICCEEGSYYFVGMKL